MFNIALNTFREIFRNRFISLALFLLLLFFFSSTVLDTLSMGQTERVITDFGLSFIEITGLLVILLLGGGMITREIEGRTIYLLLSKPIPRTSILYGKFLGFSFLLALLLLLQGVTLALILFFHGSVPGILFFVALAGIYMKLLALLALILFFSTFVSPMIALFLTVASYIIGHSGFVMLEFVKSGDANETFHLLVKGILALFPNLESMNIKDFVPTSGLIPFHIYELAFLYMMIYTIIILFLGAKILEHKSFDNV